MLWLYCRVVQQISCVFEYWVKFLGNDDVPTFRPSTITYTTIGIVLNNNIESHYTWSNSYVLHLNMSDVLSMLRTVPPYYKFYFTGCEHVY